MKLIIMFTGGNNLEITNYQGTDPENLDWTIKWSFRTADGKDVHCNPMNVDMVMLVEDDYELDPPDNSWRVFR